MNILSIIPGLTSLASELIEDPDKKVEYAFKTQELMLEYQKALITTKTHPKVDALVKLMYAFADIGQKLWRPAISGFAFIWGLFHPEQLQALADVGTAGEIGVGAVMGSFPAWGASRYKEKMADKEKAARKQPKDEEWFEDV